MKIAEAVERWPRMPKDGAEVAIAVATPAGSMRPCPRCQREIPVNRWPAKTLPTTKRWPYQVMTFVEWCGHQQEVVLVPERDGRYSEIRAGERACGLTRARL